MLPLCFKSILFPGGVVAVHRSSGKIPAHIFVPIGSVVQYLCSFSLSLCVLTLCAPAPQSYMKKNKLKKIPDGVIGIFH